MDHEDTDPWLYVRRRSFVVPPRLKANNISSSPIYKAYLELKNNHEDDIRIKFHNIFPEMKITCASEYWEDVTLMTYDRDNFVMWSEGRFTYLLEGKVVGDTPHITNFGFCFRPHLSNLYTTDFFEDELRQRIITSQLIQGLITRGRITKMPKKHEYPIAQVEDNQNWTNNQMYEIVHFFDDFFLHYPKPCH